MKELEKKTAEKGQGGEEKSLDGRIQEEKKGRK